MMVATQQFLLECLIFVRKHFDELEKWPRLVNVLKTVLDIERQFYKINYISDCPHMVSSFFDVGCATNQRASG